MTSRPRRHVRLPGVAGDDGGYRKLPIFKGAREVEGTWFALQQSEVMHGIIANLLIPPSARMLGNQRLPLIDTHLITRA